MEMQGTRLVDAPRAAVWAALSDPAVLQAAIPGCRSFTGSPADGFDAVVTRKVGPVSATFRGRVTLSDVVPGERCTLSGVGEGGAAGSARGSAAIRLADEGGGTRLSYEVSASVGGKLAQLGSRLVDGVAKRMADAFFAALQAAVEAPAGAEARSTEAAAQQPGWIRRLTGR